MFSVRGIGVAVSVSTSTSLRRLFSCSLWRTPKRAVLLVDDGKPQVLEADRRLQQLVGADDDVDGAVGQPVDDALDLLGATKARQALDLNGPVGETVGQVLIVLLGQQGGGDQHGDLSAAVDGDEGGAHGDLSLTEADIAADHAVHGLGVGHVAEDGLNGALLVGRLLEVEGLGKGGIVGTGVREGDALTRGAAGVDVEQFGGHVVGLLRGLFLEAIPLVTAKAVQRCVFLGAAGVAGDQVQGADRHVELVAAGVFQRQELGGVAADIERLQAKKTADAVILVDHRRALVQFREVTHHRLAVALAGLAPAFLADLLAVELGLGD